MVIIAYRSDLYPFRSVVYYAKTKRTRDAFEFLGVFLVPFVTGHRSFQGGFAGQKHFSPDRTSDSARSRRLYAERKNSTAGRKKHGKKRKEEPQKKVFVGAKFRRCNNLQVESTPRIGLLSSLFSIRIDRRLLFSPYPKTFGPYRQIRFRTRHCDGRVGLSRQSPRLDELIVLYYGTTISVEYKYSLSVSPVTDEQVTLVRGNPVTGIPITGHVIRNVKVGYSLSFLRVRRNYTLCNVACLAIVNKIYNFTIKIRIPVRVNVNTIVIHFIQSWHRTVPNLLIDT